jgi:hypothetical protein
MNSRPPAVFHAFKAHDAQLARYSRSDVGPPPDGAPLRLSHPQRAGAATSAGPTRLAVNSQL